MTEFVLRIFFSGLIALIPNADNTELTVLLINAQHDLALSDGSRLPHHMPLIVARAGDCDDDCVTDDHAAIAQFLVPGKPPAQAETALNSAISGGGAWLLSGSDLRLAGPTEPLRIVTNARQSENGTLHAVPTSPAEREDFSWVADISEVMPAANGFQSAFTSTEPLSPCRIAARLKLRSGKVFTYSVSQVDGKARPITFKKPSGETAGATHEQALANWVAAEIRVPGDSVEIIEHRFNDPQLRRSMRLYPQNGKIEIAVLNLPPFVPPDPNAPAPLPAPGQHFQIYYDLVRRPPTYADRLVPHASVSASQPQSEWPALHPRDASWSDLLEQLNLNPRGKAPYDLALCPIVRD